MDRHVLQGLVAALVIVGLVAYDRGKKLNALWGVGFILLGFIGFAATSYWVSGKYGISFGNFITFDYTNTKVLIIQISQITIFTSGIVLVCISVIKKRKQLLQNGKI